MDTRASAESLIKEFNGHVLPGTCHCLQVRFADTPAQKKLKTQITKRSFRRQINVIFNLYYLIHFI